MLKVKEIRLMTRNEIIEVLKNGVSEIFNDAIVDELSTRKTMHKRR